LKREISTSAPDAESAIEIIVVDTLQTLSVKFGKIATKSPFKNIANPVGINARAR
jgi:hypothetical protein